MTIPVVAALLVGAVMQQQTDTTLAVRAGARLQVELRSGSVTVRTWNRQAVRVQATHDHRTRVEVRGSGSVVRVETAGTRNGSSNADYIFTVPADIAFNADGVSMDVDVQGLSGDIDLENVNGTLRVNGGSGRLRFQSVNGDIIVSDASGRLRVSTVNRGIHLTGISGAVSAETVNGPIVMERMQATSIGAETVNGMIVHDGVLRPGGEYSLATHNGPIWLVIPTDADASIKVATFNGMLDSSFPLTVRKSAGSGAQQSAFALGNGSAVVTIESFGGDVRLRRPGEARPTFRGVRQPGSPH